MIRQHNRIAPECLQPASALPAAATSATFRGSLAEGSDGEAIRRLATLTRSAPPRGAVLLAELGGDPVAAIGIADGRAVADRERITSVLLMRLRLERLYVRIVAAIWGL